MIRREGIGGDKRIQYMEYERRRETGRGLQGIRAVRVGDTKARRITKTHFVQKCYHVIEYSCVPILKKCAKTTTKSAAKLCRNAYLPGKCLGSWS